MSDWTPADLDRIGRVEEVQVASHRPDGTLRPAITIWAVRVGDEVFVRSAHGTSNPWFRRAVAAGTGRLQADSVASDVRFVGAADADHAAIDTAYHHKYDRYAPRIVGSVTGPDAPLTTLRLIPQRQ